MRRELEGRIVDVLVGRHPLLATLKEKQDSKDGAYLVSSSVPEVRVTLEGFEGDRHAGFTRRADNRTPFYARGTLIGNQRQVSLVSVEDLASIAGAIGIPKIEAAWLGANLLVEGVPRLSKIPPATRFFFPDEATLIITSENFPCVFPGRAIQQHYPDIPGLDRIFPKRGIGYRGLVAWVERPGIIRRGDTVRIALAEPAPYPDE